MFGSIPLDFANAVMFPQAEIGRGGLGRHAMQLRTYLEGRGTTVHLGPNWNELPSDSAKDPWRRLGDSPEYALDHYDRWCAETYSYPTGTDAVIAFPGAALNVFRAAPSGVKKVLAASNVHASTHRRWTMEAVRSAPLERPWLTRRLATKMDHEAELADTIISNSSLTTRTYVEAGLAAEKIVLVPLTPKELTASDHHDSPVDVLYVGALAVEKGVIDLVRAFSQIDDPALRLRLMGGQRSPGMKAYLRYTARRDARVRYGPGDPSRQFPVARVLVHPSYSDSYAYAVAEGVAAGLPVITTERVGASDLIRDGHAHPKSRIVPAGDRNALRDAIEAALGTD